MKEGILIANSVMVIDWLVKFFVHRYTTGSYLKSKGKHG